MLRTRTDPDMAKRIGDKIRELRKATGITQETLAWDCGLDRGYVGHIEACRKLPSLPVLAQIAARLGADLLDLVAPLVSEDRAALVRRVPSPAAPSGGVGEP